MIYQEMIAMMDKYIVTITLQYSIINDDVRGMKQGESS